MLELASAAAAVARRRAASDDHRGRRSRRGSPFIRRNSFSGSRREIGHGEAEERGCVAGCTHNTARAPFSRRAERCPSTWPRSRAQTRGILIITYGNSVFKSVPRGGERNR